MLQIPQVWTLNTCCWEVGRTRGTLFQLKIPFFFFLFYTLLKVSLAPTRNEKKKAKCCPVCSLHFKIGSQWEKYKRANCFKKKRNKCCRLELLIICFKNRSCTNKNRSVEYNYRNKLSVFLCCQRNTRPMLRHEIAQITDKSFKGYLCDLLYST